jgi:hypothetical protein
MLMNIQDSAGSYGGLANQQLVNTLMNQLRVSLHIEKSGKFDNLCNIHLRLCLVVGASVVLKCID